MEAWSGIKRARVSGWVKSLTSVVINQWGILLLKIVYSFTVFPFYITLKYRIYFLNIYYIYIRIYITQDRANNNFIKH